MSSDDKPEPLSDVDVIAFMVQLANEQAELVERLKPVIEEAIAAHVNRVREYKALLEGIIGSKDA